jgi:CRISPR-associated endonuclease Cas2
MGKKKEAGDYLLALKKLKDAGMENSRYINENKGAKDDLPTLEERVRSIFKIINNDKRPQGNMLFFIMYDIEHNKVRYNVAKYLIKKGCTRIQKSIFLADLDTATYQTIRDDLTEIQSLYDNHDSIIVCPVPTDVVRNMRVIGKQIDVDIITHSKNTLFF